jgi:DNA-binding LacI/PurR family transcriptional regulator
MDRNQPDAIVCANDFTAAQLFATLNSLGVHVPSQVRVAGVDDVKYAQLLQAPLTTIHQPCLEIGTTALLAMFDRIAHPHAPSRDFLLDFRLVIRKSTASNEYARPRSRKLSAAATNGDVSNNENAHVEPHPSALTGKPFPADVV